MDYRLEKIAHDIQEGFTNGIIDDENGERTYWEIHINSFQKYEEDYKK